MEPLSRSGARAALAAVAGRPDLWSIALRSGVRLVPRGWWRRRPFLPLPDAGWLGFRLETAYGSRDATLDPADLIAFLEWCRREEARRKGAGMRRRAPVAR